MSGELEIEYRDIGQQLAVLSDPKRMDKICSHLSAGGTLIDYCKLVGQSYTEVHGWICLDEDRKAKYESAKLARQEWLFERVLEEYKSLSTFEITDLYDSAGGLKPMAEWSNAARASVAKVESIEQFEMVDGIKESVGELKKVSVWDKTKTLEALGKYLKMFREQIDINVSGELSIRGALDEAESRLKMARPVSESVDVEQVELSDDAVESEKQEPI